MTDLEIIDALREYAEDTTCYEPSEEDEKLLRDAADRIEWYYWASRT